MAISRVKTWSNGEVLTHTDLNAEYDNILNNALSLISPLTANLAAGNFSITGLNLGSVSSPALQFNGDANTGIYSPSADVVNIAGGGNIVGKFSGGASLVNYVTILSAAAGSGPSIDVDGSDTDIPLAIDTKGTGTLQLRTGGTTKGQFLSTASGGGLSILDAGPSTPSTNTLYNDNIVKAWIKTSGAGAWTIDDDFNVTSITDNGTGDVTINFATAFANALYASSYMLIDSSATLIVTCQIAANYTAGALKVFVTTVAPSAVDPSVGLSIMCVGA